MSRSALTTALVSLLLVGLLSAPAGASKIVHITGGGWGHGIGMSQYGAYGRALAGRSDTDILTHYYTGAHVRAVKLPSHIRVGLLQGQSSIAVSSIAITAAGGRGVFKVKGHIKRIAAGGTKASWRVEPSSTGGMHLFKNGTAIKKNGNAVFGGPKHPLEFLYRRFGSMVHIADKNNNYRYGHMEFGTYASTSCQAGFCLRLIDYQSMRHYLYGLSEVPSSWPRAALQAQVIAARTYAYRKIRTTGQHRYPCNCAVYDSSIDQVYLGDAKRTGSGRYWKHWKDAVTSTNGKVLLYRSVPIDALYMSSSGGYTEDNENVWGGAPVSYLRGVRDRADAVAANPNHSWSLTMPWSTFASKLSSSYNVGTVDRFKLVPPFGVSGRVTVVKPGGGGGARIVGSREVVRTSGWALKSVLGLKDTLFRVKITYTVAKTFATKFRRLKGRPGMATSKLYAVPKGSKHPKGKAQNFQHGRMTWNRFVQRAFWQRGPVLARYNVLGRERSSLGMPTSDVWVGGSFRMARYAHGNIYWSKTTGAHAVKGPFLAIYRTYGGPDGPLSLPTGHRRKSKDLPHGGVRQAFAKGALYRTPSRALYALWGPLQARYRKLGEASSACGYPTSSMTPHKKGFEVTFQKGKIKVTGRGRVFVHCGV